MPEEEKENRPLPKANCKRAFPEQPLPSVTGIKQLPKSPQVSGKEKHKLAPHGQPKSINSIFNKNKKQQVPKGKLAVSKGIHPKSKISQLEPGNKSRVEPKKIVSTSQQLQYKESKSKFNSPVPASCLDLLKPDLPSEEMFPVYPNQQGPEDQVWSVPQPRMDASANYFFPDGNKGGSFISSRFQNSTAAADCLLPPIHSEIVPSVPASCEEQVILQNSSEAFPGYQEEGDERGDGYYYPTRAEYPPQQLEYRTPEYIGFCCSASWGPQDKMVEHLTETHGFQRELAVHFSLIMGAAIDSEDLVRSCAHVVKEIENIEIQKSEASNLSLEKDNKICELENFYFSECEQLKRRLATAVDENQKNKISNLEMSSTCKRTLQSLQDKNREIANLLTDLNRKEREKAQITADANKQKEQLQNDISNILDKSNRDVQELETTQIKITNLTMELNKAVEYSNIQKTQFWEEREKLEKDVNDRDGRIIEMERKISTIQTTLDEKNSKLEEANYKCSKLSESLKEKNLIEEFYRKRCLELEKDVEKKKLDIKAAVDFADKICERQLAQVTSWKAEKDHILANKDDIFGKVKRDMTSRQTTPKDRAEKPEDAGDCVVLDIHRRN